MAHVIYKYALGDGGGCSLALPQNAQFLTLQMQYDSPCVWFLCDKDAPLIRGNKVTIVGTGQEIESEGLGEYIGTFQKLDGALVWHVFLQQQQKGN